MSSLILSISFIDRHCFIDYRYQVAAIVPITVDDIVLYSDYFQYECSSGRVVYNWNT